MKWRKVLDAEPVNQGFVWVRRSDGGIELAYIIDYSGRREFQDPYTVGDREGLSVEYFRDVTDWAYIVAPDFETQ